MNESSYQRFHSSQKLQTVICTTKQQRNYKTLEILNIVLCIRWRLQKRHMCHHVVMEKCNHFYELTISKHCSHKCSIFAPIWHPRTSNLRPVMMYVMMSNSIIKSDFSAQFCDQDSDLEDSDLDSNRIMDQALTEMIIHQKDSRPLLC